MFSLALLVSCAFAANYTQLTIIHTTDSFIFPFLYLFLITQLVHGWINGHRNNATYDATLRDLYDFTNYYKTHVSSNQLALLFDTGDLTQVSLLVSFFLVTCNRVLASAMPQPFKENLFLK